MKIFNSRFFSSLGVPRLLRTQGELSQRFVPGLIMLAFLACTVTGTASGSKLLEHFRETNASILSFSVQRVDTPKLFHSMGPRSLALDANNRPHIAYGGDHLYYASFNGTSWIYETADGNIGVGAYASLALDSTGHAYISYYDSLNGRLKYATKGSGSWIITTVDSLPALDIIPAQQNHVDGSLPPVGETANREWSSFLQDQTVVDGQPLAPESVTGRGVGLYTSITLDAFNHPSISYYDSINGYLKYAHWAGNSWEIQIVNDIDEHLNWGQYSSLALDSSGVPHISFYDATNKDLLYATWNGRRWVTIKLDSANDVGMYTCITLDRNNREHISYYDNTNGDLKYVYKTTAGWATPQVVDSAGNVGLFTSISLLIGNPGRPGIAYYDATKGLLKFADYYSGVWHFSSVPLSGDFGRYASMVREPTTGIHISFYDSGAGVLRYALFFGNTWKIHLVDSAADVGQSTSMAVDKGGRIHISYYDDIHDDLKYALWNGSAWQISTVDSTNEVGLYSSIALDSSNKPQISYYDYTHDVVKYARWNGSNWEIQTVTGALTAKNKPGMRTSIVLNSANQPRIAFYEGKNGDLIVALWSGTAWVLRTADNRDDVGQYASMAIDSQDQLHISYFNATSKALQYALGAADGSGWERRGVDPIEAGKYSSIALDASGNPGIAYFDDRGDVLKYAHWNGVGWEVQTVDNSGGVGYSTSIKFDSHNRPNISYYDFQRRSLKFARWTGSWNFQGVDDSGEVGQSSSLAFTSSGPAISYYDATNGDLKFAQATEVIFTNFLFIPSISK